MVIVSTKDSKDYFNKISLTPEPLGKPIRVPLSVSLTFNVTVNPGYPLFVIPIPLYMNTRNNNIFSGIPLTEYNRILIKFSSSVMKVVYFSTIDLDNYLKKYGTNLSLVDLMNEADYGFYAGIMYEKLDLRMPPFNIQRYLSQRKYRPSDIVTSLLYKSPTFRRIFSVPNIKAINYQIILVIYTQFYKQITRDILSITMYGTYLPKPEGKIMTSSGAIELYRRFINYFTQINI